MRRLDFLKTSIISTIVAIIAPLALKGKSKSTYETLSERVGFNHIPNTEVGTENTILHKANTRGSANHGWLQANHSFSFANYHNPNRMNFGVLRVLNDDTIVNTQTCLSRFLNPISCLRNNYTFMVLFQHM